MTVRYAVRMGEFERGSSGEEAELQNKGVANARRVLVRRLLFTAAFLACVGLCIVVASTIVRVGTEESVSHEVEEVSETGGVDVEQVVQPVVQVSYTPDAEHERSLRFSGLPLTGSVSGYQVSFTIDTLALVTDGKLAYDCSNISFTDALGMSIPYWFDQKQCARPDTNVWVRLPLVEPGVDTLVTMRFGTARASSTASFYNVFSKASEDLVGWYFVNKNILNAEQVPDDSQDGMVSREEGVADAPPLNHWGCGDGEKYAVWHECTKEERAAFNVRLPISERQVPAGTMEMWLTPYDAASGDYQIVAADSGGSIEFGIQPNGDLYFYPTHAKSSDGYAVIAAPLVDAKRSHVVITWDFAAKRVAFYIDGKPQPLQRDLSESGWDAPTTLGAEWKVGGFAFAGWIDDLRIYNTARTPTQIASMYKANDPIVRNREPEAGDDLLVKGAVAAYDPLVAKPAHVATNSALSIGTVTYATPLDERSVYEEEMDFETYAGPRVDGNPIYLESMHEQTAERRVFFGTPSHFDAYAGTPIEVNGRAVLTHVGLRVSDPTLVRSMSISVGRDASDEHRASGWRGLSFSLIPTVHACGGGSYHLLGTSALSYATTTQGLVWYRLQNHILVDRDSMVQINYVPSGKPGYLEVTLADLMFRAENGQTFRPVFTTAYGVCDEQSDSARALCEREVISRSAYRAYLAPEEKGVLRMDAGREPRSIAFTFMNMGKDSFTFDADSMDSLLHLYSTWAPIDRIELRTGEGLVVSQFPVAAIMDAAKGKTLAASSSLPFEMSAGNVEPGTYFATVVLDKRMNDVVRRTRADVRKVIHWSIGDPYRYSPKKWGAWVIYRVVVTPGGNLELSPATSDMLPQ